MNKVDIEKVKADVLLNSELQEKIIEPMEVAKDSAGGVLESFKRLSDSDTDNTDIVAEEAILAVSTMVNGLNTVRDMIVKEYPELSDDMKRIEFDK